MLSSVKNVGVVVNAKFVPPAAYNCPRCKQDTFEPVYYRNCCLDETSVGLCTPCVVDIWKISLGEEKKTVLASLEAKKVELSVCVEKSRKRKHRINALEKAVLESSRRVNEVVAYAYQPVRAAVESEVKEMWCMRLEETRQQQVALASKVLNHTIETYDQRLHWSRLERGPHLSDPTFSYRLEVKNPVVFLEISHRSRCLGTVFVELFRDKVPKTSENFRCLCTGEKVYLFDILGVICINFCRASLL